MLYGSYYTGITWKFKKRVAEHNSGIKTPIQKIRRPIELVYWEKFDSDSRMGAAKREKEIKGWRREKKENLIKKFTLRSEATKCGCSTTAST